MNKEIKVMLASVVFVVLLALSALITVRDNVTRYEPPHKENTMDRFEGYSKKDIEMEIKMEEHFRNSRINLKIMEEYGYVTESGHQAIDSKRLEFLRDSLDINPNHYKYYM